MTISGPFRPCVITCHRYAHVRMMTLSNKVRTVCSAVLICLFLSCCTGQPSCDNRDFSNDDVTCTTCMIRFVTDVQKRMMRMEDRLSATGVLISTVEMLQHEVASVVAWARSFGAFMRKFILTPNVSYLLF